MVVPVGQGLKRSPYGLPVAKKYGDHPIKRATILKASKLNPRC